MNTNIKPAPSLNETGSSPSDFDVSKVSNPPQTSTLPKIDFKGEESTPMACIANTSHAMVPCASVSSVTSVMNVPTTVTVTHSVPTTMMSGPNSSARGDVSVYNTIKTAEKQTSKKRTRPTRDKVPEHSMQIQKNCVSHGFQPYVKVPLRKRNSSTSTNAQINHTTRPNAKSNFGSILYNPQTSTSIVALNSGTPPEIQLTREQIDDVIDTTLPTNFSFQLPVKTVRLKPKIGRPRNKKPRHDVPSAVQVSVKGAGTSFSNDPKASGQSSTNSVGSGSSVSVKTITTADSTSATSSKKSPSSGRWTAEEHEAFLEGLKEFGREWKKVAKRIPTRTSAQIRSHAQKYFAKLAKDEYVQAAALSSRVNEISSRDTRLSTSGVAVASGMDEIKNEYSASVLDRMTKILNDPKGAELEVADTLRRLRTRYDELHKKVQQQEHEAAMKAMIQKRQSLSQPHFQDNMKHSSDLARHTPAIMSPQPQRRIMEGAHVNETANMSPPLPRSTPGQRVPSSTMPSSFLSRSNVTLSSESLALHSRELIALTVLGGELYRNSSSQEDLSLARRSAASIDVQALQTQSTTRNENVNLDMDVHINTPSPTNSDANQKIGDNVFRTQTSP